MLFSLYFLYILFSLLSIVLSVAVPTAGGLVLDDFEVDRHTAATVSSQGITIPLDGVVVLRFTRPVGLSEKRLFVKVKGTVNLQGGEVFASNEKKLFLHESPDWSQDVMDDEGKWQSELLFSNLGNMNIDFMSEMGSDDGLEYMVAREECNSVGSLLVVINIEAYILAPSKYGLERVHIGTVTRSLQAACMSDSG
jgi:hypothetical protein